MSPSNRKRFNAFDDFPAGEAAPAGAEVPVEMTKKVEQTPASVIERIERLKPSQMVPDRFQPRHLLPSPIRQAFFNGKLDCYQAAGEWLSLSKHDLSFKLEIDRLLAMGDSFEEYGQIKPITGSWVPASGGSYVFLIETGERRYWAACLRVAAGHLPEEPLLRVEAVAHPTRQRQVLENRHAELPSAVGQACEIASLILAEIGALPSPEIVDEFEYFRQARSQRMPAGLWEKITPIMQLTRPRMVQLLNILQMPTLLLELADRHRLTERQLREILAVPHDQWERTLRLAIQQNLTSDDLSELRETDQKGHKKSWQSSLPFVSQPAKIATSGLRRFANVLTELDEVSREQALDEMADELVATGEAQKLIELLDELAQLVQVRSQRQ